MSLFVGNISKNVKQYQLEDSFNKYGKCTIKQKVSTHISSVRFKIDYRGHRERECLESN